MTIYTTKNGGILPERWPAGYPAGSGCNSGGGKCNGTDVSITKKVRDGCGRDCGTRACIWNNSSCCYDGNQQNQGQCGPIVNYSNALIMCPTLGTTSTFVYATSANSINNGAASTDVKITCTYTAISDTLAVAWSDDVMSANFDPGTILTIRTNIANTKTFAQLYSGTVYQNFYNAQGGDRLNTEYLIRIVREKPTTWPDDTNMRNVLLSIALSTDPTTRNQTPNAISATTYISQYCLQTNPASWVRNSNMLTFINNLLTNQIGPLTTNAYLQATAETIVNTYCQSNTGDSVCGCYNAMVRGIAGCTAGTQGCSELVSLNKAFNDADPKFAPIIATIKASLVKPQCVSAACVSAILNPAGGVLRTADSMTQTCNDYVAICLNSLSAGGSISPGAKITQECKTTLNIGNTGTPPAIAIQANNNNGNLSVGVDEGPSININTGGAPDGYVMVGGTAYLLSDFLIRPGKSAFIDKIAPTPNRQKLALGMCVLCCLCIFFLLISAAVLI